MERHSVLRVVTRAMLPLVFMFALYVQFHGDFGPGGGFQAGVIFGAGCILCALVFGVRNTQTIVPLVIVQALSAIGVLLYAGVGVASLLLGGEYLNYSVLAADPVAGQHLGILLIELGVGITVASVIVLLFYTFSDRMDRS